MKRLILFVLLLCLQPLIAHSHPGKTDWRGGHMCLKGCEEWGLSYKEYHLHDKEGKPIRMRALTKNKTVLNSEATDSEATGTIADGRGKADVPKEAPLTITQPATEVYKESAVFADPMILAVLALLLFLLLLLMRRRRAAERS